jgi:hypothetical protein
VAIFGFPAYKFKGMEIQVNKPRQSYGLIGETMQETNAVK